MYSLTLTDAEVSTLAWLTDRGYWPGEAYDAMALADGEPEEVAADTPRRWEIPESAAWSVSMLADEDPGAFLTCCGDPLLSKLLALWQSIV